MLAVQYLGEVKLRKRKSRFKVVSAAILYAINYRVKAKGPTTHSLNMKSRLSANVICPIVQEAYGPSNVLSDVERLSSIFLPTCTVMFSDMERYLVHFLFKCQACSIEGLDFFK
jgi:hypothetical protein